MLMDGIRIVQMFTEVRTDEIGGPLLNPEYSDASGLRCSRLGAAALTMVILAIDRL